MPQRMTAEDLQDARIAAIRDPKVREAARELLSWLQDESREYAELIFRMLASLPGGDRLEDLGSEPFDFLGWKELDMLGNLFHAIQNKDDVEQVVEAILAESDADAEE